MSTRHFRSDIDDVDDATYQMLESRFCRVAMHGHRHEPLRHRRHHDPAEAIASGHRVKRVRERPAFE